MISREEVKKLLEKEHFILDEAMELISVVHVMHCTECKQKLKDLITHSRLEGVRD